MSFTTTIMHWPVGITYGNLGNLGGAYIRASAPPVYRCASALSSNKVETDASRALMVQSDLVALSH